MPTAQGEHSAAPYAAHHLPHSDVPKLLHITGQPLRPAQSPELEQRVFSNELGAAIGVVAVMVLCCLWMVAWYCMQDFSRKRSHGAYRRVSAASASELQPVASAISDDDLSSIAACRASHGRAARQKAQSAPPGRSPLRGARGKARAHERPPSPSTSAVGSVVSLLRVGERDCSGAPRGDSSSFY